MSEASAQAAFPNMRLSSLALTACFLAQIAGSEPLLAASPGGQDPPSSRQDSPSPRGNSNSNDSLALPVSIDKIKEALSKAQTLSLSAIDERPTFRVQIAERQRIDELLSTLSFKTSPPPAGGLYMAEMQRQWWPSVDNPSAQPLGAFNQGELLQLLAENLAGKYLAQRAAQAVTAEEKAHALATAREEVRKAVSEYCAAQPEGGAGIQICANPTAIR